MAAELLPISEMEKAAPLFRGRCGNAFARFLLNISEITAVQHLYDGAESPTGPDTAAGLVNGLNLKYTVSGLERLEALKPPFITISNHPIGSMDGVILVDLMGHLFPDYKLLVNKFLMRVAGLRPSFISVVPTLEERTGPQSDSINGIRLAMRHLRDGHPLGFFPSGAVSDFLFGTPPTVAVPFCGGYFPEGFSYREPKVRDREWQMPIIKLIKKAGVPVVPIRFFDGNSRFFYYLGAVHGWKLRVTRLPHEVMNKRDKTIRMGVGPVITPQQQAACKTLEELSTLLRASVYGQQL
ncbi:MAG: 1-acyl-sn-glycerol-3-phosphate acyltransferase [Bacteroidales bacterium]|nr:1-acyl-sn-glycerol-3-phosphate acyltransferase [Bacteroidales bacterium]